MNGNKKTEKLIFISSQYHNGISEGLLFKRDLEDQGYLLINFNGVHSYLPNKGSRFEVTYWLNSDGMYHGSGMKPLDQGAYD